MTPNSPTLNPAIPTIANHGFALGAHQITNYATSGIIASIAYTILNISFMASAFAVTGRQQNRVLENMVLPPLAIIAGVVMASVFTTLHQTKSQISDYRAGRIPSITGAAKRAFKAITFTTLAAGATSLAIPHLKL